MPVPAETAPALGHDYLLVSRGAERTFAAMADCWPGARIYTLLYDEAGTQRRFARHPVTTSPLQRLRPRQAGFRRLLPLMAWATDQLDLSRYELLVTSSSAFAHGMRPAPGGVHVCYCHTPFRYAWFESARAQAELSPLLRPALRRTLARTRRWDLEASRRVTSYLANSRITQERIARFWGRDSEVVHPPVEVDRFTPGQRGPALLVVAELVAHKRVETALAAARRAGVPIGVVGDGPELPRLRALYGSSATFHGRVADEDLARLYGAARALVVPNEEEFGIVAVEAQAAGCPVLAVDAGGARETVIDGVTGVRVPPGDAQAMTEAMRDVDFGAFGSTAVRDNALRFSVDHFQRRLVAAVRSACR